MRVSVLVRNFMLRLQLDRLRVIVGVGLRTQYSCGLERKRVQDVGGRDDSKVWV